MMTAKNSAETAADNTAGSSEVGYGCPPKSFQFKPGQRGNPSGRPRGSLSFASELAAELSIVVRSSETDERITNKRALIKQLVSAEDTKAPLSDSRISKILAEQGIVVARRTIAKYRESLQIPPVNQRKSL